MARQRAGSAKKNLYYHNALILQKRKKQTVKNQLELYSSSLEAEYHKDLLLLSDFSKKSRVNF